MTDRSRLRAAVDGPGRLEALRHRPTSCATSRSRSDAGELLGFLGPNGAGKTTTMRMILDIIRPDRGVDQRLRRVRRASSTRPRVGYLPEDRGLYRDVPDRRHAHLLRRAAGHVHLGQPRSGRASC